MRIRGESTYEALDWSGRPDRPLDYSEIVIEDKSNVFVNPTLYSPGNALELATIRAHCIEHPEGVLLDTYQEVAELELKYPSGSKASKEWCRKGLTGELEELSEEFAQAQLEHPYHALGKLATGPESSWLISTLDFYRLRYNDIQSERKEKCFSELGDVLWYCARWATEEGTSMSKAFIRFMSQTGMILSLSTAYEQGYGQEIDKWAARNIDFRIAQDIALSNKFALTTIANEGTTLEKRVTIDSAPYILLNRIIEDDFYEEACDAEMTIGKLVWFTAYTASSITNSDYAIVMKGNLQKILARSRRGTVFNKEDRTEEDEALIRGSRNPRAPLR